MSYSPYEPAPPERDRWGLNLPLAIGLVTVFLLAVIAWVIVDATRGEDGAVGPTIPPPDPAPTSVLGSLVAPTSSTTPPLLPSTIVSAPTEPVAPPPTSVPVTPVATVPPPPPSTAPPAPDPTTTLASGAVPGDLGVPGRAMSRPPCTGGYITVLGSNVESRVSAAGIEQLLEEFPNSEYLRTDQSCPSLDRPNNEEEIYVVYLGPFPEAADACQARSQGPDGAYARRLSTELGPDHAVDCD